jgi:hypothetical protein
MDGKGRRARAKQVACFTIYANRLLMAALTVGGKHSAADVVAKAQAVLSESKLLRAMFNVGYFPPNTPPD